MLKPGGWGYISWTNWYSPWGGHDMTPYHFLGPERGPRLYEKRHGPPRKNRYGEALFAVHVGPTIRLVEARPRLEIERTEPRYWPLGGRHHQVPGLRELLTWNCVIRVRKTRDERDGGEHADRRLGGEAEPRRAVGRQRDRDDHRDRREEDEQRAAAAALEDRAGDRQRQQRPERADPQPRRAGPGGPRRR